MHGEWHVKSTKAKRSRPAIASQHTIPCFFACCCCCCRLAAGEEPRTKSAALLVAKLQDISGGSPTVLVGDLNAGAVKGRVQQALHAAPVWQGSSAGIREFLKMLN
jgi:endonuclease/exonuclease/phosphatase family metal-dependent hydrolase